MPTQPPDSPTVPFADGLREAATYYARVRPITARVLLDAADHIERLEAENARLRVENVELRKLIERATFVADDRPGETT